MEKETVFRDTHTHASASHFVCTYGPSLYTLYVSGMLRQGMQGGGEGGGGV